MPEGTLRAILKQAGIEPEEFSLIFRGAATSRGVASTTVPSARVTATFAPPWLFHLNRTAPLFRTLLALGTLEFLLWLAAAWFAAVVYFQGKWGATLALWPWIGASARLTGRGCFRSPSCRSFPASGLSCSHSGIGAFCCGNVLPPNLLFNTDCVRRASFGVLRRPPARPVIITWSR